MVPILVATRNRGKFQEICQGLGGIDLDLRSLLDLSEVPEVDEDQPTFIGNALKKARSYSSWSGLATLADDSGLVVPALDGAPGVHSARYAGLHANDLANRERLLREMSEITDTNRVASFICVLALVTPEGRELTFEGRCEGRILREEKGSGGFGYDPLFFIPEAGKTMAEMTLDEKNRYSHRGRALRAFIAHFKASER